MTARILIVDPITTTRIRVQAVLRSAGHDSHVADSTENLVSLVQTQSPQILIFGPGLGLDVAATSLAEIKNCIENAPASLLFLPDVTPEKRLRALESGFDDVEPTPIDDNAVRARIRNLLRARGLEDEASARSDAMVGLGLEEAPGVFEAPKRVLAIGSALDAAMLAAYDTKFGKAGPIQHVSEVEAFEQLDARPGAPDLLILPPDGVGFHDGLATIAELRARPQLRQSSMLFAYAPNARSIANSALDMGANDVVAQDSTPEELNIRMTRLLARKQKSDALARMLETGVQLAVTDTLTGLYNRRYALKYLARVQKRSSQTGRPFAAMLLDLDWFKQVNDRFGHPAGDAVLVEVASRLRNNLRAEDLLARIGGEEFLIIIPDTDNTAARATAERLRRVVARAPIMPANETARIRVTVSIGLSMSWPDDSDTSSDIIKAADRALLIAKSQGRNMVETWRKAA